MDSQSVTSWAPLNHQTYQEKVDDCKKYGPLRVKLGELTAKILDDINVIWYLDCGSLMGAYRQDGKMLPHDDDFDFGVLMPESQLQGLLEKMAERLPEPYKVRMTKTYCTKLQVYDPNYGKYFLDAQQQYDFYNVSNDLQLYIPTGDGKDVMMMYFRNDLHKKCPFTVDMIEPRSTIVFEGVTFRCPGNSKKYLQTLYGYIGRNAKFNMETQKYEPKDEEPPTK